MTPNIIFVLLILVVALVLFVTEWVSMDLVALMVMSVLGVSGLISPADAVSGFSNPAVITVWAMFILSAGLTRAGIGELIGRYVMLAAGRSEARMIMIFMLVSGGLSAFMNNIGVAALMLPVAVEVAQRSGVAQSRLLMPLSYGALLGGLTTLIGTPPNLLVSMALRDAGHHGFGFFDFGWLGAPILLAGAAFVALFGRRLLPRTDTTKAPDSQHDLRAQYGLQERIVALRAPAGSLLVGKSLDETGFFASTGLMIIALIRAGKTEALPDSRTVLRAGDVLLTQGRLDRFELLRRWSTLAIEREAPTLHELLWEKAEFYELEIADGSALIGERLRHREFRERHRANVLAIRRGDAVRRTRLAETTIAPGDRLLAQCADDALNAILQSSEFAAVTRVTENDLRETYHLDERLFVLRVPQDSPLAGTTLGENRVGDAFDFRLLGVFRGGNVIHWPKSDEVVQPGDLLLIQGREEDLDVLRGLQQLERIDDVEPYLGVFEQGQLELVEAVLHPHAQIGDMKVADLKLRERYQVAVAAIWRDGRPYRSGLGAMALQRGDALLIVGPKHKLAKLNADPDLIVLNPVQADLVHTGNAPIAAGVMALTVGSVLAGWAPISIAAMAGAVLMVLTRCLTMEQAYRSIDWRSIFLIAGMLPLGTAMQQTGAAAYLAKGIVELLGPYGPWPVIAGLYAMTTVATLSMPTAGLVLLMAPVALSASAEMGVSPFAPMMAVAIAGSAAFASPVSHPANVLVMGPGGYRFVDYLKLGGALAVLVSIIVAVLLPIVWPLDRVL